LFGQCAIFVFNFSLGKYLQIEYISSTLTGFNTRLKEPLFQNTPRQYDIAYNQLSRPVVYTEDPTQK
jgi:hypothetical protein